MAIAFIPTDEETDASYERLNRLYVDLCEVLYLLARSSPQLHQDENSPPQETTRVRPASYSTPPRLPDLLMGATPHRRGHILSSPSSPSCSAQSLSRTFQGAFSNNRNALDLGDQIDDEVFLSGPANIQAAAAVHPPKQRRRRKRSNSLKDNKKKNKAKGDEAINRADGQTAIYDDGGYAADKDATDSQASAEEKVAQPEGLMASFLPTSMRGSLWTAVFIVVGWKLFTKR